MTKIADNPTPPQPADPVVAAALAEAGRALEKLDDGACSTDDDRPLIPSGEYDAVGLNFEYVPYRQYGPDACKLIIRWQVLVPDRAADFGRRIVVLERFYNVKRKKDRRYEAGPNSDLAREWAAVTGRRRTRREPLTPKAFVTVLCRVQVETVVRDGRDRSLAEAATYSVVRRVIGRVAGGNPDAPPVEER